MICCSTCGEICDTYESANKHCWPECEKCHKKFKTKNSLHKHKRKCLLATPPVFLPANNGSIRRYVSNSAMRFALQNIRFESIEDGKPLTFDEFFHDAYPLMIDTLQKLCDGNHYVKINFAMRCKYRKEIDSDERVIERNHVRAAETENSIDLENVKHDLQNQIESFQDKGSGYKLLNVEFIDMNIASRYTISHVVGYGKMYNLPHKLKAKKAVMNVVLPIGKENECFKYAILSALHHKDIKMNPNRAANYDKFMNNYNWSGITFPATAESVLKFERQNKGIHINLFQYDKTKDYPVRLQVSKISENEVFESKIINIMAVETSDEAYYHYVAITDINRLLNDKAEGTRRLWCDRCIRSFTYYKRKEYEEHRQKCFGQEIMPSKLPKPGSTYTFSAHSKSQKQTYVIYCDIECYLQKEPPSEKHPKGITKHIPYAFGVFLTSQKDSVHATLPEKYKAFTGENCILEGLEYIYILSSEIANWNERYSREPLILSDEEYQKFNSATCCYVCKKDFSISFETKKVADHDHVSGQYRGAACNQCNLLMRRNRRKVTVLFHNLQNYDAHLIINGVAEWNEKYNWKCFDVIPHSSEKYIGIVCKFPISHNQSIADDNNKLFTIEFKDSAQFLCATLDSLADKMDSNDLNYSLTVFPENTATNLIKQKGIFPYQYFDSPTKCKETSLPPREKFYDTLNLKECSEEDYEHALNAWNVLQCNTFEDYLLKYLELDIKLLADIFEAFRNISLEQDQLDPIHYFTIPGLSWDSAFKMSNVSVDLISNMDMYETFERGIRGGFTFVNVHHAAINSPEFPETYDPLKPVSELLYIDANNLYGKALSMSLPYKDFTHVPESIASKIDIMSLKESDEHGYLFEVDLVYPPHVQDISEDLPFAPERATTTKECLTNYMNDLHEMLHPGMSYSGCEKLLLTHGDKHNYVVHGLLLQFYLEQGMILQKVHQVIRFKQKPIFKNYIEFNSRKRQFAKSKIEKEYYKLKNNSVYGKTMENLKKRLKFKLVTNQGNLRKEVTKPSYLHNIIFSEFLAGITHCNGEILLNKPLYIGQAVLDLSKLVMYQWRYHIFSHYEKLFNCTIKILGGDTDSFFMSVTGTSVYNTLLPQMKLDGYLDTSKYEKSHPLFSIDLEANLNCIKDESNGHLFRSFVLLKPKCYSMKYVDENINEEKKAKGVRKATLIKEVNYEDYYNTYLNQIDNFSKWQSRIASQNHQVVKNLNFGAKTDRFKILRVL